MASDVPLQRRPADTRSLELRPAHQTELVLGELTNLIWKGHQTTVADDGGELQGAVVRCGSCDGPSWVVDDENLPMNWRLVSESQYQTPDHLQDQVQRGATRWAGIVAVMVTRRLHHLDLGVSGPRIAFCHGLFGQGRNWTQIAKALVGEDGTGARATLIDLPDHGRSPWSDHFSLQSYAAQVAATLRSLAPGERWTLVGHSLGGKVSMLVALSQPDLIESLAVVDIAPRHYRSHHWYLDYIAAMQALPLDTLTSRAEADALLAPVVPVPSVRAFLLQNLRRHGHTWSWQVNFDVLAQAGTGQRSVAGWPAVDATAYPPYEGPVIWIAGGQSPYVAAHDVEPMRALFPKVRQVTIKDAAHWVHSDQPEVTIEILRRFLTARPR